MSPLPTIADVLPTVPGVPIAKGVAMNAPPAAIFDAVTKQVHDVIAALPVDARGGIVGIATKNPDGTINANVAVADKIGSHVTIVGWAGKSWGQPVAGGAAVQVHW